MARYPPTPKLTVDAFWVARGKLLLVRRGRPPFPGRWALPGGFVEAGETTEEAVRRELKEETGLSARAGPLLGVFSDPRRDPRGPTVGIVYHMIGSPRVPRGGDDAAEARWHRVTELPPLAFDHDRIVSEGLRQRRRFSALRPPT